MVDKHSIAPNDREWNERFNTWFMPQSGGGIATWEVDISNILQSWDDLFSWYDKVLISGFESGMIVPIDLTGSDLLASSVLQSVKDKITKYGLIDIFCFAQLEKLYSGNIIYQNVSVFDDNGVVRDVYVDFFDRHNSRNIFKECIQIQNKKLPLFQVHGLLLSAKQLEMRSGSITSAKVVFDLNSTLYLPSLSDDEEIVPENLELALLNAPRLNLFLKEVRQISLDMGCRWSFDNPTNKNSVYDEGIFFDGIS
jgi:hypothetical protein